MMAPKKKKEYSYDLREVVIKHFLNGDSEREIACKVLIPRSRINYMIKKYKLTKCIGNIIGRGGKRKTTAQIDRTIQRKIKANRRISSTSIKAQLQTEINITISESTIRRWANEIGLHGRVARKKPYLNKVNRAKRLEYGGVYREKPLGLWNKVIWSDESKFNLFGSDGKIMVWRTTNEELDRKCTVPTVKHGGGNVKCWGCFSLSGFGNFVFIDRNMTAELYRDILQNNLRQLAKKLKMDNAWWFQHDNDPNHTARIVTTWLDREGIQRLKWPSFSSDMNPIEHLWDEVERRMKNGQPKNEKDLQECLTRVWYEIEQPVLKKLVNTIPNRLNEVICMKGYATRY